MRFFGFGKKKGTAAAEQAVIPPAQTEDAPGTSGVQEIIVYSSSEGSRCR